MKKRQKLSILLTTMTILSAEAQDSTTPKATAFDNVFTPPHLLSGDSLVRSNKTGTQFFLKNEWNTRDLKSGSNTQSYWGLGRVSNKDRDAWKAELVGLRPIYRETFFAQPWSNESTEFWLETQDFPTGKRFNDDSVMELKTATRFERKGKTEFRFIDFDAGIFSLCSEDVLTNERPPFPQQGLAPLACASVDVSFCSNAQRPLRGNEILANLSNEKTGLAAKALNLVQEKVLKHWSSVSSTFRGNTETPPQVSTTKAGTTLSSLESSVLDQACDLLKSHSKAKKQKTH